jgi:drug/metabolite transporter (DMT)-like permease
LEKAKLSRRLKADALLILVTFIWGTTFVIVKNALQDASPPWFIALRFLFAGALLFLLMAPKGVPAQAWMPGVMLGIALSGGYFFQTWGLLTTTPSKCAFITGFSVILVPALLALEGVRIRKASLAGGVFGLTGLYFLVLPSGLSRVNRGDVLSLFCAVCFAVHIVLVGKFIQRYSFRHLVPVQILVVGLLAVVALPLDPHRDLHLTPRLGTALAVTAILATALAFSVQNWAQRYTPPAHTALIFALEPVFAMLTAFLTGEKHPEPKMVLGCGLILIGMLVSELWGGGSPSPVEG